MANYTEDRAFTNHIHNKVALPVIYKPLAWQQLQLDAATAEKIDVQKGIDYVFKDANGTIKTVQERFREQKYERYTDFTIRYRRDNNKHADRRESEYFKMQARYFTYGITNCLKTNQLACTDFVKYAVIDLEQVYQKIDHGFITITNNGKKGCSLEDGKISCPVLFNKDGSSSFFPIEIAFLVKLWGEELIVAQKGFY